MHDFGGTRIRHRSSAGFAWDIAVTREIGDFPSESRACAIRRNESPVAPMRRAASRNRLCHRVEAAVKSGDKNGLSMGVSQ